MKKLIVAAVLGFAVVFGIQLAMRHGREMCERCGCSMGRCTCGSSGAKASE